MDFLNKAYAQLADLFRSMTPGARITSGLLLVAIVISLAYLVTFQISGGEEYLFNGHEFSERDLHDMGAAFSRAGLRDWNIVGSRMRIPRGQQADYVGALAAEDAIPKDVDQIMDELVDGGSIFESRQTRELRYKLAIQKKLGMTISAMPDIESATVQYDEITIGGFPSKKQKTAVVAVKAVGRKTLDEPLVETIRNTVTSGIAGLDKSNVTVTDLNGRRAYTGSSSDGQFGMPDNVYAANKRVFEKVWKEKIYERLSMYSGVVVGVNVELDPEVNYTTDKITYDPQAIAVESTSFTKSNDSGPAAGGRPGADPNLVVGNAPRSVSSTQDKQTSSEENREEQRSVAGTEKITKQRAPLVPNSVKASIGVPKSYLVRVWQKENPPSEGKPAVIPDAAAIEKVENREIRKIEDAVNAILPPVPPGDNPYPRVQVSVYDDFEEPPLEEPSLASTSLVWLESNWKTLGMFVVGLFSLVMLRSMVHSAAGAGERDETEQATARSAPAADADFSSSSEEADADEEATIALRRFRSTGPSLRDELTTMVREDPDAAANVLRNWIGDAA